MEKVSFFGKTLNIGEKKVVFDMEIEKIQSINEKIFVLLKIPARKKMSYNDLHNIYCYSADGEMIWQIGKRSKGDDVVYTMIRIDNSDLYANDFLDRQFLINKNTGEIINMRVVR